jgi:large subunit ribosomal protein L4e
MSSKNVNIYSLSGEVVKQAELPAAFETDYRPDVIRKAVVAEESNKRQPYGAMFEAGMRHSVSTWGKGRGAARVQRLAQGAKGAESPNNVGGRRAFPPKPERSWELKVNRKERILARRSALAALSDDAMVKGRGHQFKEGVTLPIVFEDSVEGLRTARRSAPARGRCAGAGTNRRGRCSSSSRARRRRSSRGPRTWREWRSWPQSSSIPGP